MTNMNDSKKLLLLTNERTKYLPLSMTSNYVFLKNGESWSSVAQYVYTSSLFGEAYKTALKSKLQGSLYTIPNTANKMTIDPYEVFDYYRHMDQRAVISTSLDIGLREKCKNEDVMKILLRTGDAELRFIAGNDSLIGIGRNNNGENLVGKILMQIRDFYKRQQDLKYEKKLHDETDLLMYEAYVFYNILEHQIQYGETNLIEYIDNSTLSFGVPTVASNIMNLYAIFVALNNNNTILLRKVNAQLKDKNELSIFLHRYASQDPSVYPQFKNFSLNPIGMIMYLRKKYIKSYTLQKENQKENIIFDLYSDYMLMKNYPDLPKDKYKIAKQQQLEKISNVEYMQLKKRLANAVDKLPALLTTEINKAISDPSFHITEETILQTESFDIDTFYTPKDQVVFRVEDIELTGDFAPKNQLHLQNGNTTTTQKILKIFEGKPDNENIEIDLQYLERKSIQALSPLIFTGILTIDGISYPSVMHYVIISLLSTLPSIIPELDGIKHIDAIVKTYMILPEKKFTSYSNLSTLYKQTYMTDLTTLITTNLIDAMDIKFRTYTYQKILLDTRNKILLWNSLDPYLGIIGNNNGINKVGTTLMNIRRDIISQKKQEEKIVFTDANIIEVIQDDDYIHRWMKMKAEDILNLGKKVRLFAKKKYQINLPLSPDILQVALEFMYTPCKDISSVEYENINDNDIPLFFINIIQSISNVKPDMIKFLWRRIGGMLVYMIKNEDEKHSLLSVKELINSYEESLSTARPCDSVGIDNEKMNCIVSAVVNLLHGIVSFNVNMINLDINRVAYVDPTTNKVIETLGYIADPKIGKDDIELASSIILNRPVRDIEFEFGPAVLINKADQIVEDIMEEGDIIEVPEDGAGGDNMDNMDNMDNNLQDDMHELIRKIIIYSEPILGDYIPYMPNFVNNLISTSLYIYRYQMNDKIKTNRINFFATLI
jgi:predicted NAD-dependent protein-ADP-ribosyltransferase YbiA (DUF1768 family)